MTQETRVPKLGEYKLAELTQETLRAMINEAFERGKRSGLQGYDALAARLEIAVKALEKAQYFGLHHYEDCSNSFYEDEPCSCGMEEVELIIREALTKIREVK